MAVRPFTSVGIDVGSVTVKVCGLADGTARSTVISHEATSKRPRQGLRRALSRQPGRAPAVVTGGAGSIASTSPP